MKSKKEKYGLKAFGIVVMDVLLLGVSLVVFAYFHHVRPEEGGSGTEITRPTMTPAPVITPDTTQSGTEPDTTQGGTEPDTTQDNRDWGAWGRKFEDKFDWTGNVSVTDSSYKSRNLNVELRRVAKPQEDIVYYVCDVYIRDIDYIKSKLAKDKYGRSIIEPQSNMAQGTVLAVNGDYYGSRDRGVVIRNGVIYRDKPYKDVCVLYYDGRMETYTKDGFDSQKAVNDGAYQAWSFGPALLDENGRAKPDFDYSIKPNNPRSVIGYYEPGHYCIVTVAGRRTDRATGQTVGEGRGMTLAELASLMQELGCSRAYNLDGGATSMLFFNGQRANVPAGDGKRQCSDMIVFGEFK